MKKSLIFILFLSLLGMGIGVAQTTLRDSLGVPQPVNAHSFKYWIDDNHASPTTVSNLPDSFDFEDNVIAVGLHHFYLQPVDSLGNAYPPFVQLFYRAVGNDDPSRHLRYWFDNDDAAAITRTDTASSFTIDASALSVGLHTLNCQYTDAIGINYPTRSHLFYKAVATDQASGTLEYWFDHQTTRQSVSLATGTMQLDATDLDEGMHIVHYRVRYADQSASPVCSRLFIRVTMRNGAGDVDDLYYWFDQLPDQDYTPYSATSQLLDASALDTGTHTLHVMVRTPDGSFTPVASTTFQRVDASDMPYVEETVVTCDSFYWRNQYYYVSGYYADTTADSLYYLDLTLHYSVHDTLYVTEESSYTWNGNTYTQSGNYEYVGTTAEGCDSVIVLVLTINNPSGIDDSPQGNPVTVYPNPTTGLVVLGSELPADIVVYNQVGALVRSVRGVRSINLQDLPSGIYTLQVTHPTGRYAFRIVKR